MKSFCLAYFLFFLAIASGQNATFDKLNVKQEFQLGTPYVKVTSINTDSTLATATNLQLVTALTVKRFASKLGGRPVAKTAPAVNDVLKWDGTYWAPGTASGGGDITNFASTGEYNPPSAAASDNDGETWRNSTTSELWGSDGTNWVRALTAKSLGGDLSEDTPAKVQGLQGYAISDVDPLAGQVLDFDGTDWVASWGNPYVFVTANSTITTAVNSVLIGTLSGAATFGLPTCNLDNDAKMFTLTKNGSDNFGVTVDPAGSQTFFDGATTKTMYGQGVGITCTCRFSSGTGTWFFKNM